jgi:hypothetical protein
MSSRDCDRLCAVLLCGPAQTFNPVEIKPEMVGMYTAEFSMSYR